MGVSDIILARGYQFMKNQISFNKSMLMNKHSLLLFANIDTKLNTTEIKLLSFALFKIIFSENKIRSTFSIKEFETFADIKLKKSILTKYLMNIRKSGFTFFDAAFYSSEDFEDSQEWHSVNIVAHTAIKDNNIYFEWFNSNLCRKILKNIGENHLLIDLSIARKLSDKSWIFYEVLKLLSAKKIHNIKFDIETFATIFKVTGKSRNSYKYLNNRYIAPILEEINSKTEYNLERNIITDGNTTAGISFSWSIDKPEFMITEGQKDTLLSLKVDYDKYNVYYLGDSEYQSIRKTINSIDELTSKNAGKLISIALKKIKEVRKNYLQEEGKSFSLVKVGPYEPYLGLWDKKITQNEKTTFVNLIEKFKDKKEIAKYVFTIAKEQKAERFSYILKCLSDWIERDYLTYNQIENHYLDNKFGVHIVNDIELSDDFLNMVDFAEDMWNSNL